MAAKGQSIGPLWKGKEGRKAVLSGSLDLLGLRLRVCVFRNEDKSGSQPDFRLVSFGLDDKKDEDTEY